jgi:lipopolysaccharide transport system ATP-binding protein
MTVISVENLSKSYLVGHRSGERERYTSLRDVIGREARNFTRKAADLARGRQIVQGDEVEEFWALKDVSFEVRQGEVLGIIGRNGAGKSTLLKILSRITEPTAGRVRIKGRVASLLEVGTGFHPELTGRENIYLNGAILGMTQREIRAKFDEIVAFADVEQFIDTPVKRFSSGMYLRLAFAVAAHLDPEILIVDEVLAVGDAEFQKKCIGKMQDVAGSGRTILFVSHNLASIEALSNRCLLVDAGHICGNGPPAAIVQKYLSQNRSSYTNNIIALTAPKTADAAYVQSLEILDCEGNPKTDVRTWDDLRVRINFFSKAALKQGSVVLKLSTGEGRPLALLSTKPDQAFSLPFREGKNSIDCLIRRLPLAAGDLRIAAGLAIPNMEWIDRKFEAGVVTVLPKDVYGAGIYTTADRSLLVLDYGWETRQ